MATPAAQLDAIAARQCIDNLVEDRVDDVLDIALVQVRIVLGNALDEFGLDHRNWDPWRAVVIS